MGDDPLRKKVTMFIYLRDTCTYTKHKYIWQVAYLLGSLSRAGTTTFEAFIDVSKAILAYEDIEVPTESNAQKCIELFPGKNLGWSSSHAMTRVAKNVTNQWQTLCSSI